MNKYLLNVTLLENNVAIPEISFVFKSILFKDEVNNLITINKSDIYLQTDYECNENSILSKILIQDNEDKMAYALGEEYDIDNIEILFLNKDGNTIPFQLNESIIEVSNDEDLKKQKMEKFLIGIYENQACQIQGAKPPELFGYDLNQTLYSQMSQEIYDYCETKILNENIQFFITKGTLGAEMISFFAIEKLKKKYPNLWNVLIVPYENIDSKWDKKYKNIYNKMKYLADLYICVDSFKDFRSKFDTMPVGEYSKEKLKMSYKFIEKCTNNNLYISKSFTNNGKSVYISSSNKSCIF